LATLVPFTELRARLAMTLSRSPGSAAGRLLKGRAHPKETAIRQIQKPQSWRPLRDEAQRPQQRNDAPHCGESRGARQHRSVALLGMEAPQQLAAV
jgi:hypothetical protein